MSKISGVLLSGVAIVVAVAPAPLAWAEPATPSESAIEVESPGKVLKLSF